ncbi:hypothetical protein IAT40_006100 [Kwoniella sp. CBS 6097]
MLFKLYNILAVLSAMSFALALPAAQPENEELVKKADIELDKRQVITCGYYEVCYCPRNGVRFTCRDPKGCSMTCYPS